jgi:hypothetical protein
MHLIAFHLAPRQVVKGETALARQADGAAVRVVQVVTLLITNGEKARSTALLLVLLLCSTPFGPQIKCVLLTKLRAALVCYPPNWHYYTTPFPDAGTA